MAINKIKRMGRLSLRTLKWVWRAWPILMIVSLGITHYILLIGFSSVSLEINKGISLSAQIIGGLLVLYTVDSNLGVVKKETIFGVFVTYLKEFPFIHNTNIVQLSAAIDSIITYPPKSIEIKHPTTIDGKLAYLQEQIDDLRNENIDLHKELSEKINEESVMLREESNNSKAALRQIESKLEQVSVGGIKIQLFGILLMIYGAIAGY